MIPFRDNGHLTQNQIKFNKVQSSLRQVVERSIGLLKGRWRKLLYLDHLEVKFMVKLIMSACVLHNFCLILDDFDENYYLQGDDGDTNEGNDAYDHCRLTANDVRRDAEAKRNNLMNALN